ncbi:hypothetical protein [Arthrobacter sp. NyZ413]|uniref:hypothetical protein n=1 Tax=Arthrobacter sp. NyZ413 TaxID=3144669 RepID=UPI003BF8E5F4
MDSNTLFFGPWSAAPRDEELVDIRHHGSPVLRGLRAVVRNHNWLTLTPTVLSARTSESPGFLELVLDVGWGGLGARYAGEVTYRFEPDGLAVAFRGTAVEDFSSNRIGLVVLHRPDDAGTAVTVTDPDGGTTVSVFPERISPHQPFKDIAAMSWEREGMSYRLDFEGDVFETEDQRNWTDASFKTYSTPLSKPFPVHYRAGDEVRQSIRLSARHCVRVLDEVAGQVPELGATILAEISSSPSAASCTVSASAAGEWAASLKQSLDARIVSDSADDAVGLVWQLPLDSVRRLGVYSASTHVTEKELWDAVAGEAGTLGFQGELVAGARSHFTELNRNPGSAVPEAAGITYSITPQMHAVETEAILETLPMQRLTADEALRIGNGRPLHIGPITLAPRFNAVATEPPTAAEPTPGGAPEPSRFAAAWLLGSIAALSIPGVASLNYGDLAEPEPARQLLQQLAVLQGCDVLKATGSTEIAVYPVRTGDGTRCFVANLTARAVVVRLSAPGDSPGAGQDLELSAWQTATVQLP